MQDGKSKVMVKAQNLRLVLGPCRGLGPPGGLWAVEVEALGVMCRSAALGPRGWLLRCPGIEEGLPGTRAPGVSIFRRGHTLAGQRQATRSCFRSTLSLEYSGAPVALREALGSLFSWGLGVPRDGRAGRKDGSCGNSSCGLLPVGAAWCRAQSQVPVATQTCVLPGDLWGVLLGA